MSERRMNGLIEDDGFVTVQVWPPVPGLPRETPVAAPIDSPPYRPCLRANPPTIGARVVAAVAQTAGVPEIRLRGRERTAKLARLRFAIEWTLRQTTGYSTPEIGRVLDRDHTTVLYGLRRARELRLTDSTFRTLTDGLVARFAPDLQTVVEVDRAARGRPA